MGSINYDLNDNGEVVITDDKGTNKIIPFTKTDSVFIVDTKQQYKGDSTMTITIDDNDKNNQEMNEDAQEQKTEQMVYVSDICPDDDVKDIRVAIVNIFAQYYRTPILIF